MTTDDFRTNCTPEEWAAYERGMLAQATHDTTAYRTAAFGAIRRAAEVTREAERLHLCHYEANYIRRAIRAAIGSAKT